MGPLRSRAAARVRQRAMRLGFGLLGIGAASLLAGAVIFGVRVSAELSKVERRERGNTPPSRVVASDGTLLSSVLRERRSAVSFSALPDATKLAFLAAEDAHFYARDPPGYIALVRALWAQLVTEPLSSLGTPIAEQVLESVSFGVRERSLPARVAAAIERFRLARALTKDELFALYLNQVDLGHARYGVDQAARYYFGKGAGALDAAESALLAGLVRDPERLSPRRSRDAALARRREVLKEMLALHFLTDEFFASLVDAPLKLAADIDDQSGLCPEAVDAAREVLSAVEGAEQVEGGYTVTTSIVPELQFFARRAVRYRSTPTITRCGPRMTACP
jgi:penicillin-binding protein 1A